MVGDKFARVYSLYFNEILFCLVFKYFNIKVFLHSNYQPVWIIKQTLAISPSHTNRSP